MNIKPNWNYRAVSNRSYVTVPTPPRQIGISVSNLVTTNELRYTLVICHPLSSHKGYNYPSIPTEQLSSVSIPSIQRSKLHEIYLHSIRTKIYAS